LQNVRENGVRSLAVRRSQCRNEMIFNADRRAGGLAVKSFEPRIVCTQYGTIGADVRPN
jgi:hypothetical protein